jgi:hypothetical protein
MIASSSGQPPASLLARSMAISSMCIVTYAPSAWKFGYSFHRSKYFFTKVSLSGHFPFGGKLK